MPEDSEGGNGNSENGNERSAENESEQVVSCSKSTLAKVAEYTKDLNKQYQGAVNKPEKQLRYNIYYIERETNELNEKRNGLSPQEISDREKHISDLADQTDELRQKYKEAYQRFNQLKDANAAAIAQPLPEGVFGRGIRLATGRRFIPLSNLEAMSVFINTRLEHLEGEMRNDPKHINPNNPLNPVRYKETGKTVEKLKIWQANFAKARKEAQKMPADMKERLDQAKKGRR